MGAWVGVGGAILHFPHCSWTYPTTGHTGRQGPWLLQLCGDLSGQSEREGRWPHSCCSWEKDSFSGSCLLVAFSPSYNSNASSNSNTPGPTPTLISTGPDLSGQWRISFSNTSLKPHLGWDPTQFPGSSLAEACTRRLLAKIFQCQSNPTFSCHFLTYLSSVNSRPPTHRFLIRIGGLRIQLSSLIPFIQPAAVESLSSSWLGPLCRDLESKQSLKSYDSRNCGWHHFLLLTVPTFLSSYFQNKSWRLLSALITIRCIFLILHFVPLVSHIARNS